MTEDGVRSWFVLIYLFSERVSIAFMFLSGLPGHTRGDQLQFTGGKEEVAATEHSVHRLECASKAFDKEKINTLITLARQIDLEMIPSGG